MEPATFRRVSSLFRLQFGVFTGCIEAGAISVVAQVAVTYDDGAGVALAQLLQ